MKLYSIAIIATIFLSSCLKESIPEAMLNKKNGPKVRSTISYKVNGDPVEKILEDGRDQGINSYNLICRKQTDYYYLYANTSAGSAYFYVDTDSLAVGHYNTSTLFGNQVHVLDHSFNNRSTSYFMVFPGDSISMNITSHANGYVSGNFSAVLTPLIDGGSTYIYGTPSSTRITEGSFTNVLMVY